MPKPLVVALSILLATAAMVGACWLWAGAQPTLGQRSYSAAWTGGMRCGAIAAILAGHALLAGVTFPAIYRPRGVYAGAALCLGGVGVIGAVAAAGLLLAGQ